MAQHIEDVRATRLVEVRVQRVLGALKIAFENERPGADDAFGVHVVPRRGVLLDVGQSALPVLAVLDGVDAHAAETHRRLQHERRRKLGEIELEQLVHRTGFEEQVGVEAGQRSSHGGLVLEQADVARQAFVVGALDDPGQGVLGVRVHALPCVDTANRLVGRYEVQSASVGDRTRESVVQHGMLGLLKPGDQRFGHVGLIEHDHGLTPPSLLQNRRRLPLPPPRALARHHRQRAVYPHVQPRG